MFWAMCKIGIGQLASMRPGVIAPGNTGSTPTMTATANRFNEAGSHRSRKFREPLDGSPVLLEASMRPGVIAPGNSITRPCSITAQSRFNEAGSHRSRKCARTKLPFAQPARFNEAGSHRSRKCIVQVSCAPLPNVLQ